MTNLILGFDPGLNTTGWGVIINQGNNDVYVDHGTIITDSKNCLGSRLNLIYEEACNVLKKHSPKSIAVEKIFANKNPESTLKLGKARAIIFLVAARFKIDIFEYSPNTVKKNIVGYGHAQKNQVIDMVKRFFPVLTSLDHNSADALAVAICHSMHQKSKIKILNDS